MRFHTVLVLMMACVVVTLADDSWESQGVRLVLKIYDDCSQSSGFSLCLKKKAYTFLDRLGRMEKLPLAEGINVVRDTSIPEKSSNLTDDQSDSTLPRALEAKEDALDQMLLEKATNFISSRKIQVSVPQFSLSNLVPEEGRGKKGGGMKGMMGGMMMGIAAKMAALVPVAIAGLFLLAGKALITAKIALLLAGIIAIKKLFGSKGSGGTTVTHSHAGWSGGGGGSGWQASGGGWDKRSLDDAQKLAYSAHIPK